MINKIKKQFILLAILIGIKTVAFAQTVEVKANKTNVAGNYGWNLPLGIPALDANMNAPSGHAYDSKGNLYIVDSKNTIVRKVDVYGTMTTFAGFCDPTFTGGYTWVSGSKNALRCYLPQMKCIAIDQYDNVYITCTHMILRIDQSQYLTSIAGAGTAGSMNATTSYPFAVLDPVSITIDKQRNMLYFIDNMKWSGGRIRKLLINQPPGVNNISLFAGGNTRKASPPMVTSLTLGATTELSYSDNPEIAYGGNTIFYNDGKFIYRIPIESNPDLSTNVYSCPPTSTIYGLFVGNFNIPYFIHNYQGTPYLYKIDNPSGISKNIAGSNYFGAKPYQSFNDLYFDQVNISSILPTNPIVYPSISEDICGNVSVTAENHLYQINNNLISKIRHPFTESKIVNGVVEYTPKPLKFPIMGITDVTNSTSPTFVKEYKVNYGDFYWSPPVLPSGTNKVYSLAPFKNTDVNKNSAITTTDLLLLQRDITGSKFWDDAFFKNNRHLEAPYKYIACDVDNNGVINSSDVLRMKRAALDVGTGPNGTFLNFPSVNPSRGNRLWAFVNANAQFPIYTGVGTAPWNSNQNPFNNPATNPIVAYNSPFINIDVNNQCNPTNKDFYAFKLGDITWDINPTLARSAKPIEMFFNKLNITEYDLNQTFNVPVRVNNFEGVAGLQFSFSFDPTHFEIVDVANNNLEFDFNIEQSKGELNNGVMSMLWSPSNAQPVTLADGTTLFTLKLKKKRKVKVDDFVLTSDLTAVEAINDNLEIIPVTKKKCKIIDNGTGAVDEYNNNWDILPNYSKNGNLFIKATRTTNKTVTITVKDLKDNVKYTTQRSLVPGVNNIYLGLRSKISLASGIYAVSVSGMDDESSKVFFVGETNDYATDEDIATNNLSDVVTTSPELALQSLQIALYKKLAVQESGSLTGVLETFFNANATGAINTIYQIENLLTEGAFGDATTLLNGFSPANAVQTNYKNYFEWILQLSNDPNATIDANELGTLVTQCPLTSGFVVFSARDLANYLTEDNVQFADLCPVNTAPTARGSNNSNVYKLNYANKPVVLDIKKSINKSLISVYPNPTKGNVNIFIPIEEKGVWTIQVQDALGRVINTNKTNNLTRSLNIKVSEQPGLYFVTLTNTTTNKKVVEKVVVN